MPLRRTRRDGRCDPRRPFVALLLPLLLAGCLSHSHTIGGGPTGIGESTARQFYVLFGLLEWNSVDVQSMTDDLSGYEIDTRYGIIDILLAPFLLPFTATSRTVRVRR